MQCLGQNKKLPSLLKLYSLFRCLILSLLYYVGSFGNIKPLFAMGSINIARPGGSLAHWISNLLSDPDAYGSNYSPSGVFFERKFLMLPCYVTAHCLKQMDSAKLII